MKRKLNKLLCRLFNHKWKYNFPSLPNKAICTRCKTKITLNLRLLEWEKINEFPLENRTNKQLIKDWVKL